MFRKSYCIAVLFALCLLAPGIAQAGSRLGIIITGQNLSKFVFTGLSIRGRATACRVNKKNRLSPGLVRSSKRRRQLWTKIVVPQKAAKAKKLKLKSRKKAILLACQAALDNSEAPIAPTPPYVTAYPPEDSGFFGMKVQSALIYSDKIIINTTGASYVVQKSGVEMWRQIDPATNDTNPREVAKLQFAETIQLGPFSLDSLTSKTAQVSAGAVTFRFNSDSFFFVTANVPLNYKHVNLISDVPWNKGANLDRMWTDGYGGSLMAYIQGSAEVLNSDSDQTEVALESGAVMAHMVFPPKPFDFESLYGLQARPFIQTVDASSMLSIIERGRIDDYLNDGFGVFLVWNSIYTNMHYPQLIGGSSILGYKVRPEADQLLRQFIAFVHNHGFKVITYLHSPKSSIWNYPANHPQAGQHQDVNVTLQWMREFQAQYGLDGWYFDNADVGSILDDYNFMRQVRTDLGQDKIIFHHDSVDVWGRYTGLRAIMVDVYANYTITGETGSIATVDTPADPYFRFFTAGYGLSQSYASQVRKSLRDLAISEEEKDRVLGENLNGVQYLRTASWLNAFKPGYQARRAEYLSGSFNPDVSWPIDNDSGWFRTVSDVQYEFISGTSIKISWTTPQAADTELEYTSNGIWWESPYYSNDGPDGAVTKNILTFDHQVTLSYLKPQTNYKFRIRSNNRAPGLEQVIWGSLGEFSTGSADQDNDGMLDDWELEHFGTLVRSGGGDFDGDSVSDLNEAVLGTNPRRMDSDYDGFTDYYEVTHSYDPLDWNDPPVSCNNNGICQNGTSGETAANCPNDCPNGRLGYWPLDHNLAWDASGQRAHGRVYGAQWSSNGANGSGGAFSFDGGYFADYIDIGTRLADPETYGEQDPASTITAWVKPSQVNRLNVITHHLGGFDFFGVGSSTKPGQLITMVWDAVREANYWPASTGTIEANRWSHVAFVFQSGVGYKFYINGVLDKEESNSALVFHKYTQDTEDGRSARIGYGINHSTNFGGAIDEITVWNRVLSAAEVCKLSGKLWIGGSCQSQD